jgi:arylsulfatase A-like enzyme
MEPATIMVLAFAFGLATGLFDTVWLTAARLTTSKYLVISPHFIWMAPVADVLIFGAAGVAILLGSVLIRRLRSAAFVLFAFGFLAWASILVLAVRLHGAPLIVLSAGLAVQTARAVARRPRFARAMGRSAPWMAAVVTLIAAVSLLAPRIAERRAVAGLGSSRAGPNVLLLILDTVRAQNLGLYGYSRPTSPTLDSLARSAIVFDRAISTAPWTMPAHGSMFTGRAPQELSTDWVSPLDRSFPTLAEALRDQGYLTAGFVGNSYYAGSVAGMDRGFVHFEDYNHSLGEFLNSSSLGELIFAGRVHSTNVLRRLTGYYQILGRKDAGDIRRSFVRWLDRQPRGRPFFAFLNFFDAHSPYLPREPFGSRFGADSGTRREPMSAYDGTIAQIDHEVGQLLKELVDRGLDTNTVVIVTADHGELFGEHGLRYHGNSLYRPLLQVPLLIRAPGRPAGGRRIEKEVSLIDLPATVLDLVNPSGGHRFPGQSLARWWAGGEGDLDTLATPVLSAVREGIRAPPVEPVSRGDMLSLIGLGLHYIRNGDGKEELYDFETDQEEVRNLIESPPAEKLERLRALAPTRLWEKRRD